MEDITKNVEKKINETADKLQEGVEKARKQGVDLMEKSFPNADEAIEKAKARGEDVWQKAKTKGQDLWDDIESTSQKTWGRTKDFIQKRPAQALGYAVLFGLVIGALIYPKGRD